MSAEEKRPYVTTLVHILGIPSSCNSCVRGYASVDAVDLTERININLEVGQSNIGAGLESDCITASVDVKRVNGCQDRISIFARAIASGVGGHETR
jgi:hypothetical protein